MNDFFSKVTINGMPYSQYLLLRRETDNNINKKTKDTSLASSGKNNVGVVKTKPNTNLGLRNNGSQKSSPKVGSWPVKTNDGKYLKTQVHYQELTGDTFAFNFLDKNREQVLKLEFTPENKVFKIANKAAIVGSEFTPEFAHTAGTQIIKDSIALGKIPYELKSMIKNVNMFLTKIR